MSAYLSPIGNEQQSDSNGAPLSGGKLYFYAAGTSTPATTYTGEDAGTPQANPVVLNASGLPDSPIWLEGGTAYKLIVKDAGDVTLRTVDNLTGVNDPATDGAPSEWVVFTGSPTYISATSFSVEGDQTGVFQVGRRLKSTNTGGTVYSSISASAYDAGTGLTTVTLVNDSGTLDAGLSAVAYGLLSVTNPSIPVAQSCVRVNTANGLGSTSTAIRRFTTTVTNQGPDITYADSATAGASFTINRAGVYAISYSDVFNAAMQMGISVSSNQLTTGVTAITAATRAAVANTPGLDLAATVAAALYLSAGSVVRAHCVAGATTGAVPSLTQFTIVRVA